MRNNAWETYSKEELNEVYALAERYRSFLSTCKTEREVTSFVEKKAIELGYVDLNKKIEEGETLKSGDKIYVNGMGKTIVLFQIGETPLEQGMNILCAHIDSPRIDIKQNPLYENSEICYLDTRYYGGIKKYQWATIPLALHGVVCKKDGTTVHVNIGEDPSDPILYISDILIHLASKQMVKPATDIIPGEQLDIVVGTIPETMKDTDKEEETADCDVKADGSADQDSKDKVKAHVLHLLKEKYDFDEDDFFSAELEIVPAGPARDCGLDRSMIAGYGHDDRVCAYPSFEALVDVKTPKKTACCLLVDKEEIGSMGATGMQSAFFENAVAEMLALQGRDSSLAVRRALSRSRMLSSDVSAAYDPLFSDLFEKKNSSYLGHGMSIAKYTGGRGKSGCNDSNAEYLAALREMFDREHVNYQNAEIGAVDAGGGGTISFIAARFGMEVVDSGLPVLSMHAPCEVVSKADIYEAKKAYMVFLKNA